MHLQPYKGPATRHRCPQCNKPRCFTLYVNDSGQPIHPTVGKCDRLVNCGYHLPPKQYYSMHNRQPHNNNFTPGKKPAIIAPRTTTPGYIPEHIVQKSLCRLPFNNLVMFLFEHFNPLRVVARCNTYRIGNSKHWPGATVFWQTDMHGHVRTGKVMLYNAQTGRRVKEPVNHITWAHTLLKLPQYNLQQCLFGEHLLATDGNKRVAIVESEKTALVASLYYPQYTWLATGGLSNLNAQNCHPLRNRQVLLMPDLNAHTQWQQKAARLKPHIPQIAVSNFLQTHAPAEHHQLGYDLGDYLVGDSRRDLNIDGMWCRR